MFFHLLFICKINSTTFIMLFIILQNADSIKKHLIIAALSQDNLALGVYATGPPFSRRKESWFGQSVFTGGLL